MKKIFLNFLLIMLPFSCFAQKIEKIETVDVLRTTRPYLNELHEIKFNYIENKQLKKCPLNKQKPHITEFYQTNPRIYTVRCEIEFSPKEEYIVKNNFFIIVEDLLGNELWSQEGRVLNATNKNIVFSDFTIKSTKTGKIITQKNTLKNLRYLKTPIYSEKRDVFFIYIQESFNYLTSKQNDRDKGESIKSGIYLFDPNLESLQLIKKRKNCGFLGFLGRNEAIQMILDDSEKYLLIANACTTRGPTLSTKLIVYDIENKKIIYEDKYKNIINPINKRESGLHFISIEMGFDGYFLFYFVYGLEAEADNPTMRIVKYRFK